MADLTIKIPVTLDSQTFRDFGWFNTVIRGKSWQRPAIFAFSCMASAAFCFAIATPQNPGVLAGGALLVMGLWLPLGYFWHFIRSLKQQAQRMGLPRHVYTIHLTPQGVTCYHTADATKPEETPWEQVYGAWRYKGSTFLYVQPGRAWLLPGADKPGEQEKLWQVLRAYLDAGRLHENG